MLLLLPAATDSYCYCLQVFEGELIQKLGELFADAGLVAMVNRCGQVGRQAGRKAGRQAGRQADAGRQQAGWQAGFKGVVGSRSGWVTG